MLNLPIIKQKSASYFVDVYYRFLGKTSDDSHGIKLKNKKYDNIRNKISLPLVALERLSYQRHVDKRIISLAYENLCEIKYILDNLQES